MSSINNNTTMSEKRTLALSLAEARELYRNEQYTGALLRMIFTKEELEGKDELPTWSELGDIQGYAVNHLLADVYLTSKQPISDNVSKFIFATESHAKSALAMAQLSQLMKALGDECIHNWHEEPPHPMSYNKNVMADYKYTLSRYDDKIYSGSNITGYHFLAFKTKSVRDAFLAKHEKLIKEYFEL